MTRQGADAVGVTEVGAEAVSLDFRLRVRPGDRCSESG